MTAISMEGPDKAGHKERYSSYKVLRESGDRRPSGEKIVLIHPSNRTTDAGGKKRLYGELASAGSVHPPQGLCSLAAILRENGYVPGIVDAEALGIGVEDTIKMAMSGNPRYVGITSYTVSIQTTLDLIKRLKAVAREKRIRTTIILGGPHVNSSPGKTIEEHPDIDFEVYGEGEITIVELLDALEYGEPLEDIPNLVYREGDAVRRNYRRPLLEDMDELPLPAWDLLPRLDRYYHPAANNVYRLPSIAIVTSRGCPGKCIFCNPRSLGTKFRGHSAQYILRMLRHLHDNFGVRDVFISDDMFVFDRRNALELCRLLKEEEDIDMTWSVFARVNYVDKELLRCMKDAGCWQIGYGLESGSNKILELINKQQTTEEMERAVRYADEVGIVVRGLFMVGNFGETRETVEETINFVKRNPIKDIQVTFFTPFPGTPSLKLWPKYGTWNTVSEDGREKSISTHNITFVPRGFTEEMLRNDQKRIYRAFIKPGTVLYHAKKLFRPSTALFILKGGVAFLRYAFKR